jgi:hypothetical protein
LLARADTRVRLRRHWGAALLERRDEVEELETQITVPAERFIVLVESDRTIGNFRLLVDGQKLSLGQVLEYVAHAKDYDCMTDNQDSIGRILAGNHLGDAAQAEDDIAPALTTGWPMVEFAEQAAEFGLIGELLPDPRRG